LFFDLSQGRSLFGQFVRKREFSTLPRRVGCKPAPIVVEAAAITPTFLFEPIERMLEPGDRAKRRDGYGKVDLIVCTCALQNRLIMVVVATPEFLALIDEIKAAD